jgi:uncharacterized protein (TIGR00266 family)
MAIFCGNCGKPISGSGKFCPSCGTPVTAIPDAGATAPAAIEPVKFEIQGDNLQILRIKVKGNQEIYAEAGKMVYKTNNVNMETKASGKSLGDKVLGALKRKVVGESLFTTHFTVPSGEGEVGFAGDYPGRIEALELNGSKAWMAQRDAFLCAESGVNFSIALQKKIGAGLFGGEGFILEKFTGFGKVFIHAGGDFVYFDLQPGEIIQVDTGCVVAFEETIDFDIQFVGGIATAIFGGEGLFLATLKGPGKLILQTMTLSKLRRELGLMAGKGGGEQSGLGSVLGIIGGND